MGRKNYSNDESDKRLRRRNFVITVYILPLMVMLIICGIVYYASQKKWLTGPDTRSAYLYSLCCCAIVYVLNKRKWRKKPDGSYHHVNGIPSSSKINTKEPVLYEEEYYYSKKIKFSSALLGLGIAGVGVYLVVWSEENIILPAVTILSGLILVYLSVRGFSDHKPKLKLAKEGLWTERLGFVDWAEIARAQVSEDSFSKSRETVLEIYLKGSPSKEFNQPDERLFLTELEDKQFVELAVETRMSKRINNS
jgi:hypothetical protein